MGKFNLPPELQGRYSGRVLSLFDGISVAKEAIKGLGFDMEYHASEIDPNCLKVSADRHPDIVQLGPVEGLRGKHYQGFDLLIGGSPCQNLSTSSGGLNIRTGIGGAKSKLFWDYLRIKREMKPRNFLFENVGTMGKETAEIITDLLEVPYVKINSREYTGQNRVRYYWTNLKFDDSFLPRYPSMRHAIQPWAVASFNIPYHLYVVYALLDPGQNWRNLPDGHPAKMKLVNTTNPNPGGRSGVWKLYSLDGWSPTITASGIKQNLTRFVFRDSAGEIRFPTPEECEVLQGLPLGYTKAVSSVEARYHMIGNAFSLPVIQGFLHSLGQ